VVWAFPWKKQLVLMVKLLVNWEANCSPEFPSFEASDASCCKGPTLFRSFPCQPGSHWLNLTLQSNGGWYCPPLWNQSRWPVCNQEAQLTMLPIKFNMQQAKSLWLLTSSLCSFWKLTSLSQSRDNQNLFGFSFSFSRGWLPLSLCIATFLGQCQFPSGTLISATRDQLITANINRRCRKKN
jgi:hypothetical protein